MLTKEWERRVEIWLDELHRDFYTPLGTVRWEGYATKEMRAPEAAREGPFRLIPAGTEWGRKWEYGWFRTQVGIPENARGRRVVLFPKIGGEMLVWVNAKLMGSIDLRHNFITLTRNATPGEIFHILIESYAGHGPRLENGGPYLPGRIPVPEPPEFQLRTEESPFAVWNEDAYQLGLDVYTLYRLLPSLDPKSLRAQNVAQALKAFTLLVDFEQPQEMRNRDYRAARKALAPALACRNGSTAPLFTLFGQSHLDLMWKWPTEETKRKCARTLSTQAALMDEYPEYRFLLCEPPILDTVRQYYPELYFRIREKTENGQFIPEGGFYVECDTNIPSGESLIRQLTYGKRWFRAMFGVETKLAWLPDSFGFTAALPQILAGCGIRYFATQKLLRCLSECDPFPYNIFWWEGMDGTRILSHLYFENNSAVDPGLLNQRWKKDRHQQEDIDTFLFPFGFGDGGGGATRDLVELARRVKDLEGAPRTRMASPVAFFEDIERRGLPKNRYVGELYLQWHRGTYTSQAELKKGCRRCEIALHEAEFWCTAADVCGLFRYPAQELNGLWKKLLLNQFHDLLAGTSITRVNKEGRQAFAAVQSGAHALADHARAKLAKRSAGPSRRGIVLFNSLSWNRNALVRLPAGATGACGWDGQALPSQTEPEGTLVRAQIPPCGCTTIFPLNDASETEQSESGQCVCFTDGSSAVLENEYLRVLIDTAGRISGILDKETGMQITAGLCNNFKLYKDVNIDYDAWEIGSMYESLPVKLKEQAEIFPLFSQKKGPCNSKALHGRLISGILVKRKLHNSALAQRITLESGSRRIDFHTTIDWKEQHKLLKVEFPVSVCADEAIHEIQFGYVKRPNHVSRRYDADRYEVCCHRYTALAEAGHGVAVLNDCKYGVSVNGSSINLTLLKAPVIPDMYADQGKHTFTYSLYIYNGSFADGGTVQNAYELNFPVQKAEGAEAESLFTVVEGSNSAVRAPKAPCSVLLETAKEADDGSGDVILRLYESQKTAVNCTLHCLWKIKKAFQTDMKEENAEELDFNGDSVPLRFRPFEIKTLRLQFVRKVR
jgi:alpha-mannosidase